MLEELGIANLGNDIAFIAQAFVIICLMTFIFRFSLVSPGPLAVGMAVEYVSTSQSIF